MTERPLPPWPDFRGYDANDVIARREDARVGALVFRYDVNRRVYRGTGMNAGAAIERYYFCVDKIESETRVSWILSFGEKIPKKDPRAIYGSDDVEDALWCRVHAYRIADRIRGQDAATLRKIAELIGYTPDEGTDR